jgi:N-acetylmuramoyl-L-alanine amidase
MRPFLSVGRRPGMPVIGFVGFFAACRTPEHTAVVVTAPRSVPADAPVCGGPLAPRPAYLVERPLPGQEERTALMADYLRRHAVTGLNPGDVTLITPKVIVLHWTAGPTSESAWSTFAPARIHGRPDIAAAGAVNVASHYLVDRDGTAYELLDPRRAARHTIGLNHLAIGIENVGDGDRWPLTAEQADMNARLVRWLVGCHPITHLIGHHEAAKMASHVYYQEADNRYVTSKTDPGDAFVDEVWHRAGMTRLIRLHD